MREPTEYVWYVEAKETDKGEVLSSGSAVAVSLTDKKDGRAEKFLLTCAHVIRQASAHDDEGGFGSVFSVIHVWPPNTGKTTNQRLRARVLDGLGFPQGDLAPDKRGTDADDWVLLLVERNSSGESIKGANALARWGQPVDPRSSIEKGIVVAGYPGGRIGFEVDIVNPVTAEDFRLEAVRDGILTLRGGEDTGGGMSGGGVFGPDGLLWGLHRSTRKGTRDFRAVSINYIREELETRSKSLVPAAEYSDRYQDRRPTQDRVRGIAAQTQRQPMHTFLIHIKPKEDEWEVSLRIDGESPNAAANAEGVNLNVVRRDVAKLFRDWALRRRVTGIEKVQQLGTILYKAVFPGEFKNTLRSALPRPRDNERLHVSLIVDPGSGAGADAELRHLPWEYLVIPQKRTIYFASAENMAFSRCLRTESTEITPADTLNVLVIRGATEPDSRIDKEIRQVVDDLKNLSEPSRINVEERSFASSDELKTFLTGEKAPRIDVLHYVGIGRYLNEQDELLLSGDNYVDAVTLAKLLKQMTQIPATAILQQCSARREGILPDFGKMAPTLIDHGVDGVVAFQDPVSVVYAKAFNTRLYSELEAGEPLQIAVQKARKKKENKEDHSFVSPALFTNGPNELVLLTGRTVAESESLSRAISG